MHSWRRIALVFGAAALFFTARPARAQQRWVGPRGEVVVTPGWQPIRGWEPVWQPVPVWQPIPIGDPVPLWQSAPDWVVDYSGRRSATGANRGARGKVAIVGRRW